MYPSSHSRRALSSPESVSFVTFPGSASASETLPSKCVVAHKLYFPWLLESPSECDVSHNVMFLTWLLESPSECEIAHMVARARTLVPISESESKLTYRVPGFSQHRRCVIARGRLRRRTVRSVRGPAFEGAPSDLADGPPRASRAFAGRVAPPRLRRRLRGRSRASGGRLRAWGGPRRSGGLRVSLRSPPGRPPGLRCSSRRVLRRSRSRCPLGFPFSLSPLLYLHSINRHPPCQAPAVWSLPHFRAPYAPVGYPSVEHRGPRFSCVDVTYPSETYGDVRVGYHRVGYWAVPYTNGTVAYTYVAVTYGYVGKGCH